MRQHVAGALLLAALLSLVPALSPSQTGPTLVVKVVHVVDGDTIEVCCIGGKGEKVRYIGINTREAAEANRKLVAGKSVCR